MAWQQHVVASHFQQPVAPCAEVSAKEIIALNHGMDPKNIQEKQTILIPAGKLSSRDKEILAGTTLFMPHFSMMPPLCPASDLRLLVIGYLGTSA